MSTDQFIDILGVDQVADLATCVNPMHWLACQSVPESNASISCTTSTAHCAMLVWRPSDRLDSSNMVCKFDQRLRWVGFVPYH